MKNIAPKQKDIKRKGPRNHGTKWTSEEDAKLIRLIKLHGKKWTLISNVFKVKSAMQCRDRWCNHLDPNINKSPWTKEEDMLLIKLQKEKGNSWTKIAKCMNGRTENDVKNRFHGTSIKRLLLLDAKKYVDSKNTSICTKQGRSSSAAGNLTEGKSRASNDGGNSNNSNTRLKRPLTSTDDIDTDITKKRPKRGGTGVATSMKTSQICTLLTEEDINEKDLIIIALNKENERLKQQLANKNERESVIDALIERLKQQLSNKNERESIIVAHALIARLKQQQLPEKNGVGSEIEALAKEIERKDLAINAQNIEIERLKQQLPKKNEKNFVIDEMIERLKEQLANETGRESVIYALIERLKKQLSKQKKPLNDEIKRLKQQLQRKNENDCAIEQLEKDVKHLLANETGKDLAINAKNKEIERLKQLLLKKIEKNFVIDEMIERLKQQLSNKTERASDIIALIGRLKKQLLKKNEKDSIIETCSKKIDTRNIQIERLKQQQKLRTHIDVTETAKVDVEVDPLANFPLGSRTILVGDCYGCDVCKEAYFYSYDEACYHESLCQIYRDRIAAKAALEKVNKALAEKMKSINMKKSSGNDDNVPCNFED
ncbi:homeodomain-like protein [Chaetoceros tenuissimus]|uniref:Homeodomain-like protein n=1 Tax=Chaetoceros tenuissimus TaxID=426638 RepID=A0AAD3D2Y0_9STRA|nr:homeodomain-like protein [Chaetoceros tenuissimus]